MVVEHVTTVSNSNASCFELRWVLAKKLFYFSLRKLKASNKTRVESDQPEISLNLNLVLSLKLLYLCPKKIQIIKKIKNKTRVESDQPDIRFLVEIISWSKIF